MIVGIGCTGELANVVVHQEGANEAFQDPDVRLTLYRIEEFEQLVWA